MQLDVNALDDFIIHIDIIHQTLYIRLNTSYEYKYLNIHIVYYELVVTNTS